MEGIVDSVFDPRGRPAGRNWHPRMHSGGDTHTSTSTYTTTTMPGAACKLEHQQQQQPAVHRDALPPPPPPQQQHQQQQQQLQQPPPAPATTADVDLSVCQAIVNRGKCKGMACGRTSGKRVAGFCGHHDGKQERLKRPGTAVHGAAAAAGGGGDAAAGEKDNYDSDQEVGGCVDAKSQTSGAGTAMASLRAPQYYKKVKAESMEDTGFDKSEHLKKTPDPPPNAKPDQTPPPPPPPPPPPAPHGPKGWALGRLLPEDGAADDASSSSRRRNNKRPGGDKSSLSGGELKARVPTKLNSAGLNGVGLSVFRDLIRGKGTSIPFVFFEEAFPPSWQEHMLSATNNYTEEAAAPSPPQKDRHRAKKPRSGSESVLSTEIPDGSEVFVFERKHLYGFMGILVTATRITRKRRLSDHWGLGPMDDYPLVRNCMRRDDFMLLYSRFFRMSPKTQELHKDHPDFDEKHQARRAFDQRFDQAIRKSYLLFKEWARALATQCSAALEVLAGGGAAGGIEAGRAGGAGGEADDGGSDLSVEELEDLKLLVAKSLKMERATWEERLAGRLMSSCSVINLNAGGKTRAEEQLYYGVTAAKSPRMCLGGGCAKGPEAAGRYRSTRTQGVCWCNVCSGGKGKARALHLCMACHKIPEAHVTASKAADNKKTPLKKVDWARVPPA